MFFLANLVLYDLGKLLLLLCPCSICFCGFEPQLPVQVENEFHTFGLVHELQSWLVASGRSWNQGLEAGKVTFHNKIVNDKDE